VPRLVFTRAAQTNLIEIADYIESRSGSSVTAQRFCSRLIVKCQRLARLRGPIGRSRPELLPGLRSTPFGNYVIFFHYVEDTFEVVNILEGHLDVETHFKNKDE
jgi:plasmid stabilization system protein ParE